MTTSERSYTTIDKTDWDDGPWQHEPDKLQWVDEATGLDCLIVRNRMGALCGYVGVPTTHPAHGKNNDSVDVEVHGGLTYSNSCQEDAEESEGICHVPEPGRPDDVWWFGFDCSHLHDAQPGMDAHYRKLGMDSTIASGLGMQAHYRDLEYVRGECAGLAQQLKSLEG